MLRKETYKRPKRHHVACGLHAAVDADCAAKRLESIKRHAYREDDAQRDTLRLQSGQSQKIHGGTDKEVKSTRLL